MAGRYASSFHMDFCYNPVCLSKNGRIFYVPCGKCNGCLLQKSNSLSMRLGDDIESYKFNIFFTLTYNNYYVPKLRFEFDGDCEYHYFSAAGNVRFNGKRDVLRDPIEFWSKFSLFAPLTNYPDKDVIGYLSKSDIQLYLKLLRKDIYENFNISSGSFRYFIVGEYGPGKIEHKGKLRPHYHGIVSTNYSQVADYLLDVGLFKNWSMCDEGRFKEFTKYCNSGTRSYVTEYVNSITSLPTVLKESKEIKPFTLSSRKEGGVGTMYFNRKKVLQEIECGIDEFTKRVPRVERNYLFRYPSYLTNSLFPKCSRFSLLSFDGLLRIYEYLYNVREVGVDVSRIFNGFSDISFQDYQASSACLKVCDSLGWSPYHYVEVLVDFYYRKAMQSLRYQYEFQKKNIDNKYLCIAWYYNYKDFINADINVLEGFDIRCVRRSDSVRWFLDSFGLFYSDDLFDKISSSFDSSSYEKEVDSIIEFSDKSKKVNAKVGVSPDIV